MAEKTYDGAAILGAVSGLGKGEVMRIWEKVKANSATLDGCAGPHAFEFIPDTRPTRFRCTRCGGEVNGEAERWYRVGLLHGAT